MMGNQNSEQRSVSKDKVTLFAHCSLWIEICTLFCTLGFFLIYLFLSCAGSCVFHLWAFSRAMCRPHCDGFFCCGAWALGTQTSVVAAPGSRGKLSSCGARAQCSQCVESSQTRVQPHIPCIGRLILNHWTTRGVEILYNIFLKSQNMDPVSKLLPTQEGDDYAITARTQGVGCARSYHKA